MARRPTTRPAVRRSWPSGPRRPGCGQTCTMVLGRRAHCRVGRDRDGEVLVGGAHRDEQDGEVGRDTGHDDVVHAHVAQHGQHLRAVHRRDALIARQHQVGRPHADLGDDLGGGVCPVPLRRRRGGAHQRCPPVNRAPSGARQVGQVGHLDTRAAGAGGEEAHGVHRGPGRLGQRGKNGKISDDATLAFDEQAAPSCRGRSCVHPLGPTERAHGEQLNNTAGSRSPPPLRATYQRICLWFLEASAEGDESRPSSANSARRVGPEGGGRSPPAPAPSGGRPVAPGGPAGPARPGQRSRPPSTRPAASGRRGTARRGTRCAAVSPVSGSATASAQNIGVLPAQATKPPATAASSPNPTRLAPSPERPYPVMEMSGPAGRPVRPGGAR